MDFDNLLRVRSAENAWKLFIELVFHNIPIKVSNLALNQLDRITEAHALSVYLSVSGLVESLVVGLQFIDIRFRKAV